MKKYDIAAYVWPSYTGDEVRTRMFWPQGFGEWQTVMNTNKRYPNDSRPPLITVNSWNEWTETSYLEPDDLYGYGYLEAIKRVFCE